MATTSTPLSTTAYTLISSADQFLAQNTGRHPIRIAFAASLPSADTEAYMLLPAHEGVTKKSGFPANDLYAMATTENQRISLAV